MALKKTRKFRNTNIGIKEAYCRIDWLRFDAPCRVAFGVGVYESEESAASGINERLELLPDIEKTVEDFGGKENVNAVTAKV